MRKVHCADCGKSYDYDVDDFCPRCGSFNPPPDSGATRLEQELLSRFQQPGTGGQKQKKSAPYSYHPTYGSGPDLKKGKTHTARIQSCTACGPEKKKKGNAKSLVILLVVLAAIFLLPPLVEGVVRQVADIFDGFSETFISREEEASVPAPPVEEEEEEFAYAGDWYASYDTFPLSTGQDLTVGGAWEPWMPDELMEQYPEGTRCVAVGMWVMGQGDSGAYIPLALATEDGTVYLPEELPEEVWTETGLDPISLSDGTSEEEIYGYCFYFLPEEVVGQQLTMMVMDEENIYVSLDMEWEE